MLRGYRGIILAFAGLILIGAGQPSKHAAKGEEAAANAGKSNSAPQVYVGQPTGQPQDAGCEQGKDNRNSDLCAQWKAADAANEAARWSWWQMISGFFGLFVGGGTLFFAARAAHWAKKAADQTERAANEAEKAVAETRRIGEAQVRSYLTAESARIVKMRSGQRIAYCTVKNSGNSPASEVKFACEMTVFDYKSKAGALFVDRKPVAGEFVHQVPAGQEVELGPVTLEPKTEESADILNLEKTLVTLRVAGSFEDVFGQKCDFSARFDDIPSRSFNETEVFDMQRSSDTRLHQDQ